MPLVDEHEQRFAAEVDRVVQLSDAAELLLTLCDERHAAYVDRSAPAITRMRGWVLEALGRRPFLADAAIPYVLEELEAPSHPYLLAAAARCLRAVRTPHASFAVALAHAFRVAPSLEAPVTLGLYGGFGDAPGASNTSPVREVVATIAWLGPLAAPLAEDIHDTLRSGAAAPDVLLALEQVLAALPPDAPRECCAELPKSIARFVHWQAATRRDVDVALDKVRLEDHRGNSSSFRTQFRTGQPTIVAFFYTRCDNPFKCTLTVAKLGQVQRLLHARGLGESIRTMGITYDPEFDTPAQLSRYGVDRGLQLNAQHVLIRATAGFEELKQYFALGVSFFESLVSRHRIEVFVLDGKGRIAATFHRLNWREEQVVDRAAALAEGEKAGTVASPMASLAGLAALAVPKCPLCWATYASVLGFSGALTFPAPWALRVLAFTFLLVYVTGMLWRARRTGLRLEHAFAVGGCAVAMFNTFVVPAGVDTPPVVWVGAALMACASVVGVARRGKASASGVVIERGDSRLVP